MNIERYHWRHYFGGMAFLLIILQLASGMFLSLFYLPDLGEAYASVQSLYRDFPLGAWVRDSHRWIAAFLVGAIIIHAIRSLLRKEFLGSERKVIWLTGGLLLLPLLGLMVTGAILPWEWKGYWFMEMVPNYLEFVPLIGPWLKQASIDAFSINRNFAAHVVIIPFITIVLLDFHIFHKLRIRRVGLTRYLLKHAVLVLPFLVAIAVLAIVVAAPTLDPDEIPLPLEGTYIPAPEWFILMPLVPFMYFENFLAPLLGVYLAFGLFVLLAVLPYIVRQRVKGAQIPGTGTRNVNIPVSWRTRIVSFLVVFMVVGVVFGAFYAGGYRSPTLGCNSCHNVSYGARMGVPPKAFKDRKIVPLLDDNQWMVEHWFFPQVVW